MKEKMAELKQNGETLEGLDLIKKVAKMWKEQKNN